MQTGGVSLASDRGKVVALPVFIQSNAIRLTFDPGNAIFCVVGILHRETDPHPRRYDARPPFVASSAAEGRAVIVKRPAQFAGIQSFLDGILPGQLTAQVIDR